MRRDDPDTIPETRRHRWLTSALTAFALLLASCGGGSDALSPDEAAAATDRAEAAATTVTVAGDVTFTSVPNGTNGGLDFDSARKKPVRGARVVALKSGTSTVLATTTTTSAGRYSMQVPVSTKIVVRVYAQMVKNSGTNGRWDVTVRDNTRSGALYSMQSPAFTTGSSTIEKDLNAASGWGGSSYTKTRVAAPFAVLDTVYNTIAKVRSAAPTTVFPALKVFWSVNNRPSGGDPNAGDIGTTFYTPSSRSIYVLGQADVDTDEFDSTVIAHEWGHYYQDSFSRDDSLGGAHSEGDLLDRSVAFSEGWGNAWSGIALNRAVYADSNGFGQSEGFTFNLGAKAASNAGWFNETSIQYVLWSLNRQVGFAPIHKAMTGRLKRTPAITSIHAFADALGAASSSSADELRTLLASQKIATSTSDPFGGGETNKGGVTLALPLYRSGTPSSPPTNACTTNAAATFSGDNNKLGGTAYVRIRNISAGTHTFTVTGPSGADPDLALYQGRRLKSSDDTGRSETMSVSGITAGDVVLSINDYNASGSKVCYKITVN